MVLSTFRVALAVSSIKPYGKALQKTPRVVSLGDSKSSQVGNEVMKHMGLGGKIDNLEQILVAYRTPEMYRVEVT